MLTFFISLLVINVVFGASMGQGGLNPCRRTKCPRISTALLSREELFKIQNFCGRETSRPKIEQSWLKVLKKRREKSFHRTPRIKRSSARTIVSLNTTQTLTLNNKKCHKYAMFQVRMTEIMV